MSERNDVFKCDGCGLVVEVMNAAKGILSCCDKPMAKLEEKTADQTTEKHVPVMEQASEGCVVKVGTVAHPMEEKHFIQWVEVINGDYVNRKYLKPGEKPEAPFYVPMQEGVIAREMCNVHGLWKNQK